MKPVKFEGFNKEIAKNQEEYRTLPCYVDGYEGGRVIQCWELTSEEFKQVNRTRRIWVKQLVGGGQLQPILVSAHPLIYMRNEDGSYREPDGEKIYVTAAEAKKLEKKQKEDEKNFQRAKRGEFLNSLFSGYKNNKKGEA
jgi:hypothetical protein